MEINTKEPKFPLRNLGFAREFNVKHMVNLNTWTVQISRSVMSDSLRPHESQHSRPPCPSPTPGVHSDSRPSSQWCHPAISSTRFKYRGRYKQTLGESDIPEENATGWPLIKSWSLYSQFLFPTSFCLNFMATKNQIRDHLILLIVSMEKTCNRTSNT